MKRLSSFTIALLMAASILAQAPQKMSYQCVVRNSTGNLVTNQSIGLKISILHGSATGTVVFSEIYSPNPQTNSNGLVTVEIGSGTASTGSFADISWSTGTYFLKTETDPTGGTNYTISGTSQLMSVPYALYAKSAGNGFSGNYNDLTNRPTLFSGSYPDLTNRPTLFDGAWASITGKPTTLSGYGITDAVMTFGNQEIADVKRFSGKVKVSFPTEIDDAVSKEYVDRLISRIEMLENYLNQAGITISEETVHDIDNNIYRVVTIADQQWMGDNLKVTKYNDGSDISSYYWYNNNESGYKIPYGGLYTWSVASSGNICPAGWHVPSIDEWQTLLNFLGTDNYPGGKLREIGTTHWFDYNFNRVTNETKFSAVGGGLRDPNYGGVFDQIGSQAFFWSTSESGTDASLAKNAAISSGGSFNVGNEYLKTFAFSIRCVKN